MLSRDILKLIKELPERISTLATQCEGFTDWYIEDSLRDSLETIGKDTESVTSEEIDILRQLSMEDAQWSYVWIGYHICALAAAIRKRT